MSRASGDSPGALAVTSVQLLLDLGRTRRIAKDFGCH
jgi:hypothetical protein